MNLKDAAANLNQVHPEDILHPLYTPWGEMIIRSGSYDDILSEYPRPQMRRTDYHMQTVSGNMLLCLRTEVRLRRILHILPLRVSSGFLFLRNPCFPE